jgi:hypothetical protein
LGLIESKDESAQKARGAIKDVLKRMGIKLILNAFVKEVRDGNVTLRNGKTYALDAVIWAAGLVGPDVEVPCASRNRRGWMKTLKPRQESNKAFFRKTLPAVSRLKLRGTLCRVKRLEEISSIFFDLTRSIGPYIW